MIEIRGQIGWLARINRDEITRANFTRLIHFQLDDVGTALVGDKARVYSGCVGERCGASLGQARKRPVIAEGICAGCGRSGTV